MLEDQKRTLSLLYDIAAIGGAYLVLTGLAIVLGGFHGLAAPFWAFKAYKTNWPSWFQWGLIGCAIAGALALGFNPFRSAGEYGSARWATRRDLKKFGLRDKVGMILGALHGAYLRVSQALSSFVVAPPGSGKSAALVIPNLLSCGNTVIAIDFKGELYQKTAPRRSTFSRVVKFAPGEDESAGWNVFDRRELPAAWADKVLMVDRVASLLYAEANAKHGDEGSNYFLDAGRAVFIMFAQYLIHTKGETSIPEVRAFALSEADTQAFIARLADEPGVPDRVREEGYSLSNMADRQFSGVWGTFKNRLDVFADPRVATNFSRCDFTIKQLRAERLSVYLKVAPADVGRLSRAMAVFCETACLELLSVEPKREDQSVTWFFDEFARFPAMEAVASLPALSRSYRVNAMFVVQSDSQIVDRYGLEKAKTLRNSCAYHVYFAQNEIELAEQISRSIGPRTRKKLNFSTSETRITRNTNETNEGVPLVLPQDVMGLERGKLLILVQNNFPRPILANAPFWFEDNALKPLVPRKLWNLK